MDRTLQAIGVGGPLLVVVGTLGLGWIGVTAILKAWNAALETMRKLATSAIDAHVREHHAGDEEFQRNLTENFRELTALIREVHKRMDDHLNAEAAAALLRREESAPTPPPRRAQGGK